MRRKLAIALAGVLSLAGVFVAAPAASAAAPPCTDTGWRVFNNPYDNRVRIWFPAHSPQTFATYGYGYWSCSLSQGSYGWGVLQLQRELNDCYGHIIGTPLDEDKDFGPLTKAALVKVQQHHGIYDDGKYGPQTARTMNHPFYNFATGYEGCWTLSAFGFPGNSG